MKTDVTDEQLPQTEAVFVPEQMDLQKHQLVQQGYELIDMCTGCPRRSFKIPTGQLLLKDQKGYRLVDEVSRV